MTELLKRINTRIAQLKAEIEELEQLKKTVSKPRWSNAEDMLADLSKLPKKTKRPTLEEIDHELDIIRGVKPTPVGYKVRPERMKELMRLRRELVGSL